VAAAGLLYGIHRWNALTQEIRARLDGGREPIHTTSVAFSELDRLPAAVQRYFRAVLEEGQPIVVSVRLRHRGTFNLGETTDRWRPFTSDQKVVTRRPGFDWDGRIAMLPGVPVRVHDAYVAGEGILHASLLGLFPVANLHDTKALAEGELMRFLAEAAWYPTALLPSQGVRWEAVDDRSARGTLTDGEVHATLLFTFNAQGLIDRVRAEARGRTVNGTTIPTPWGGHFWNYEKREHMLVPLDGEVSWLLPEGPKPYWRGHLAGILYER
jgi:hypothetical protein